MTTVTEKEKKHLNFKQVAHGKTFKWMVLVFAIYLIVIGSMLVYESSRNAEFDIDTNWGLIGVGIAALIFCGVILIAMVYAQHKYATISLGYLYIVVIMIMFGTTVGTLSIVNGVDVPNLGSRGTLGWVFGGITTGVGVIATLWCIFALVVTYNPKLAKKSRFARWAVVDVNKDDGNLDDDDFENYDPHAPQKPPPEFYKTQQEEADDKNSMFG